MSGVLLPLLRGLHLCAVLSLFGVLVFAQLILPGEGAAPDWLPMQRRRLTRLARHSAALALLLGAAWLLAETAELAGVSDIGAVLGFLPVVALHTQFGGWLALRLGILVLLLLPAYPVLRWPMLLLAGAALGIQPMLGHAGAETGMRGNLLVASEVVHLLAAGAWLGGLLPLWLAVRSLPAAMAAAACTRFSRFGIAAVTLVALTGLLLGSMLVGGAAALIGTVYGRLILLKTGLFALALLLAGLNRFVFTPDLAAGSRHRLLASVAIEAAIGTAIVLAAAFLASRMPGADMPHHGHAGAPATQQLTGLWPTTLLGLGIGAAGVLAATLWRRTGQRWIAGRRHSLGPPTQERGKKT